MTSPAPQSLPAEMAAQLAQLRDIRLPEAVSWWPLAPGWWALLVVLLVTSVSLIGLEYRRRRSLKYQALQELQRLKTEKSSQLSTQELATDICILVRRVVLNGSSGRQFASTHGESWGEYLAGAPNGMPAAGGTIHCRRALPAS